MNILMIFNPKKSTWLLLTREQPKAAKESHCEVSFWGLIVKIHTKLLFFLKNTLINVNIKKLRLSPSRAFASHHRRDKPPVSLAIASPEIPRYSPEYSLHGP